MGKKEGSLLHIESVIRGPKLSIWYQHTALQSQNFLLNSPSDYPVSKDPAWKIVQELFGSLKQKVCMIGSILDGGWQAFQGL